MNRPFGAVDVSANLKGAVPKTATQKILVALAEKGELVQKTYGVCYSFRAYMRSVILEQGKRPFLWPTKQIWKTCPRRNLHLWKPNTRPLTKRTRSLLQKSRLSLWVYASPLVFLILSLDATLLICCTELAKTKSTPTDDELASKILESEETVGIPVHFWRIYEGVDELGCPSSFLGRKLAFSA